MQLFMYLCSCSGGLYVTYREGTISGSKHKCCRWRLDEVANKHLRKYYIKKTAF